MLAPCRAMFRGHRGRVQRWSSLRRRAVRRRILGANRMGTPQASESPWPNRQDRLFRKSVRSEFVYTKGQDEFKLLMSLLQGELPYFYREGYYQAGRTLAMGIVGGAKRCVIYPMAFCYRQFIELSLKATIVAHAAALGVTPPEGLSKNHGIMPLWNQLKCLFEQQQPGCTKGDETLSNVERCLNDLHAADASSQLFRYPTDKAGHSVDQQLPDIDVAAFANTMDGLYAFFVGLEDNARS